MNNFAKQIKEKKVLIFGLGLQGGGFGDALWLHSHGAIVKVTDQKDESLLTNSLAKLPSEITLTLGQHLDTDIEWADLIIKNPGVAFDQPQILLASKLGKPIVTSIALVVQAAREKTIGITGTRGKSTTTELAYTLLDLIYPGQILKGGNLSGTSPLSLLDNIDSAKYLVLELSSFQLAGFHPLHLSPRYAILTNIYPDHLNRYQDMTAYKLDKSAIFVYQKPTDYLFVNGDNQEALAISEKVPGTRLLFHQTDTPADWNSLLPGSHNRENIAAVIALSQQLGIDLGKLKKIVSSFHALPFRLELIRELAGVKYYNDTTSTTPTATVKAIEAFADPLILILGGDDKKLPTTDLIHVLSNSPNVKQIILLGCKNIPAFVSDLKQACPTILNSQVFSMSEAVFLAHSLARPGDVVLLSPGFASFDLFDNEFARGRQFNEEVAKLTS